MNKLKLIIKREYLAKVKNKSFIILTVISPLLVMFLGFLIFYLNEKNSEDIRKIAFVDQSGELASVFKDTKTIKYTDLTSLGEQEARKTASSKYYGVLVIPKVSNLNDFTNTIKFYSQETPGISLISNIENKLEKRVRNLKIAALNVDVEKIKETETKINISTQNFTGEKSSKVGSILRMLAGGGFGYLIFMFIIIYGTSVMRSVIEEKTSRIIEVIISSVKPFQLMLGKILGNAFAGLTQFLIWMIIGGTILTVVTFYFSPDATQSAGLTPEMVQQVQAASGNNLQMVLGEIKNLPILTIFFSFIVYFFGGYLIYSSIYAAIGAAVDSETDTQQFMMPVLMPLVIAIYVGFSIIENPHGSIAVGFSIFPLTSPIVMLMRIPFGVPWWQIALSMLLLIATFIGIVWFAAKIYRIGILMYGKKPTYKEIFKWLKY
ncbi:MAG: ABC transporter permease [Lutibacter sp.]